MKHIFVLGMNDLQHHHLKSIRNSQDFTFHSVLDAETLVDNESIDFDELLNQSRQSIIAAGVPVDAILAHWDFPTSVLAPILCHDFGLPYPSLESVLKCEHKYWSRLEQNKVVPEVVPDFCPFDPFDDDALSNIHIPFPFWIKPVKSFSSQLGFRIENDDDFNKAKIVIQKNIRNIGEAFDRSLSYIDLPEELSHAGGCTCLAEEIITGVQLAPEGSVYKGKFNVHGMFHMHQSENGKKLDRLEYPSQAPSELQNKIINISRKFMANIGFDNGCFNIEFMWDERQKKLRLIEVNTRISQSHSEMFLLVDGVSNHKVPIEIALGTVEEFPRNQGPFQVAAKFIITHPSDGYVRRVPTKEDIESLRTRFPHLQVTLEVEAGMELNQLHNQDAYSFVLGEVFLGANTHDELLEKYQKCLNELNFDIVPLSSRGPLSTGGNFEEYSDLSLSDKNDRESLHPDA